MSGLLNFANEWRQRLALAGLETLVHLVDDICTAPAAHQLVIAVPTHQRLERITDLHLSFLKSNKKGAGRLYQFGRNIGLTLCAVNASF